MTSNSNIVSRKNREFMATSLFACTTVDLTKLN